MEILKFSEPPKRSNRSGSAKRSGLMPMVTFGIAVLVLGGMSTTLAGTISLGTGNTVEFGQGVVTTAACDTSIKVIPTSSFDTGTGQTYSGFHVSQIQLSGIGVGTSDTTTSASIAAGCLGKTFTIRGYDSNGTALKFNQNSNTTDFDYLSFKLSGDTATAFAGAPTFSNVQGSNVAGGIVYQASGDWKALTTLDPGTSTSTTGVITIVGFKQLASLTRITVETSQ
jgi:hypothetical protein